MSGGRSNGLRSSPAGGDAADVCPKFLWQVYDKFWEAGLLSGPCDLEAVGAGGLTDPSLSCRDMVAWDAFAGLCEAAERRAGDPKRFADAVRAVKWDVVPGWAGKVLGDFADLGAHLRMGAHYFGGALRSVRAGVEDLPPGLVRLRMRLLPGRRPSLPAVICGGEILAGIPRTVGARAGAATVEWGGPTGICFAIERLPCRSRPTRVARWFRWVAHMPEALAAFERLAADLARANRLRDEDHRIFTQHAEAAAALERRRLAAELHDDIGQRIVGIGLRAGAASRLLASGDTQGAADALRAIGLSAERARESIREISARPAPRLSEALAGLAAEMAVPAPAPLDKATEQAIGPKASKNLFRIAQEALANACRHGQPGSAQITVVLDRGCLELTVSNLADNRPSGKGSGLASMRDRAARIGAAIFCGHAPNGRYEVRCSLPLPRNPNK